MTRRMFTILAATLLCLLPLIGAAWPQEAGTPPPLSLESAAL